MYHLDYFSVFQEGPHTTAAIPEEYLVLIPIRAFANRFFIKLKKKNPVETRHRLSIILFPWNLQTYKGRKKC